MNKKYKLAMVKIAHSLIWAVMALASLFILYSGIFQKTSILLWVCIYLLLAETLILSLNNWVCPLTLVAMRYTSDRQANFDIYLPIVLAKYNKHIFGVIFTIGLGLVLVNILV